MKLSQQAKEASDWIVVRDLASQIYGENKAAKVEITSYSEYNDETYDDRIGEIAAYDDNGNQIRPDYSLPFFQLQQWKGLKSNEVASDDEDDDEFFDLFSDLSLPSKEQQRGNWVLFEDLPEDSFVYDLTTEPTLTLPTKEELTWPRNI